MLRIVADRTGYPVEMLELDLHLEADLGIDTVKQAETFATLREEFQIPTGDDLSLQDYPTLQDVVRFVREARPNLAAAAAPTPAPAEPAPPTDEQAAPNADLAQALERADQFPRRVPVPALRPPIELFAPTGVEIDASSRVLVAMDRGGVGRSLASRLKKLGATVLTLDPRLAASELEARLDELLAPGPVQGVYWLPALDVEPDPEQLEPERWRSLLGARVKSLYRTARRLHESLQDPGSFLVSATRLGGLHGLGPSGATAPMGGAVAGFTKALGRERPELLVKVVDFAPGRRTAPLAEALIEETLADPGAVEVGRRDGRRFGVVLRERPAVDGHAGMELGPDTVFLVTGAAGGITSAIVSDLAAASGGVFHLLDLAPAPRPGHPQLELLATDRDALKLELAAEMKRAGLRPTPREVERRILALEREEAIIRAMRSVEQAGGSAIYHPADMRDGDAVATIVERIRAEHGRIDVLLHAAGVEISHPIQAKEPAEFDLVLDVKADGLFNLLRAARGLPIGAMVLFSSIAARFGNRGQTDYAAANDLLCKLAASMRRWRPETRAIAIDWTAWAGVGMATRGSLPRILERAGIDLLPLEVGVPTVRRELCRGATRGELLVGKGLGVLAEGADPGGGLDPREVTERLTRGAGAFLSVGRIGAARLGDELELEIDYDPRQQPFLADHQVQEGVPYLPGVVGTELFAELASFMAPGMAVTAVEDLVFDSPLKFHRNQPRTLLLRARALPLGDGPRLQVRVALESLVRPPKPELPPRRQLHFTATVRLNEQPPEPPAIQVPARTPAAGATEVQRAEIYRTYFHGPAYQVLERVEVAGDSSRGTLAADLPAETAPEVGSLLNPRLLELCFQTAGQWELTTRKQLCLPRAVESAIVFDPAPPAGGGPLYSLVTTRDGGESFDAQVVDEAGRVHVSMKGYRTVRIGGPGGRA